MQPPFGPYFMMQAAEKGRARRRRLPVLFLKHRDDGHVEQDCT